MHHTDPGRFNILVVDDTPDNLKMLTHILTKHGYTVRPAINGKTALKAVQRLIPDLILLDIIMPGMSGYEVCEQLKADERTRHIPVIFISALHDIVDKIKAFKIGGVDFITKPFQPEEVLIRVNTHLLIHSLQHQLQEQITRFQLLSEAAFEGIVIHDHDHIFDINYAFEKMFGYHRADLIGTRDIISFLTPECRELALAHLRTNNEHPYEAVGLKKDGVVFPVEVQMRMMTYQGFEANVTAIRDISRQKAMEEENQYLQQQNIVLKSTIKDRYRLGEIIGKSQVMQEVYELIIGAAASDHNVLIYGESGTGKELVARTIHAMSPRHEQRFVPVNCGAVSEALFEREFFGHRKSAFTGADLDKPGFFDAAHRGVLFLDEVGELSSAMQVKLLRAIETGEYTPVGDNISENADIRIIAATNKHLETQLNEGLIREDFFYRLHVIEITVPPLRDRKEDIPLLFEHFLKQYQTDGGIQRIPVKMEELLYNYDWPGNVRELQNKLKQYLSTKRLDLVFGRFSDRPSQAASVLPSDVQGARHLHEAVAALEKKMIAEALAYNRWHKGKTAEMLGIPRKTLQRKMQKYNI